MNFKTKLWKTSVEKTYDILLNDKYVAIIEEYEVDNIEEVNVEHGFCVTEVIASDIPYKTYAYYHSIDECFDYIKYIINNSINSFEKLKSLLQKEISNIISIEKIICDEEYINMVIKMDAEHFSAKMYRTIAILLDDMDQINSYSSIDFYTQNNITNIEVKNIIFRDEEL